MTTENLQGQLNFMVYKNLISCSFTAKVSALTNDFQKIFFICGQQRLSQEFERETTRKNLHGKICVFFSKKLKKNEEISVSLTPTHPTWLRVWWTTSLKKISSLKFNQNSPNFSTKMRF